MNKRLCIAVLLLQVAVSCTSGEEIIKTDIPAQVTYTPIQNVTETLSIGDGGLISGKPCNAPCFYGVILGETSRDSIIPILEEHGFHKCGQDLEGNVRCAERILISFSQTTSIVNGIGYYLEKKVSVEEIIDKFGSPDTIVVVPGGIPESPATTVLLLYDELKMRLRLPEIESVDYHISETTEIELVNYFDDTAYAEQQENIFSQGWQGYGVYEP